MIPSNAELTLLRTRPQSTKLWLSVYKPPTVLACQVATSHGQGAYQIDYDTVTWGSHLSVESGMTMYVGTSLGASDIGKIRVRSIDANQITVAENGDINWTDGYYLTIVRFWEINAIFPRIIQDPADETNTLWYKDYDITYVDQNDNMGSFICMGSHYAGFLATGSHGVYYSASGTHNVQDESLTYSWWFQGATVTGSSANTPGFIQYNTPGHYTTRLTVTTPTGTYDSSFRHISIYDRPQNGTTNPILRWEIKSLSGSRDSGGYTAHFVVHENFEDIVDGALVVVFADDEYGDTEQSIGNGLNRGSIVFVGYILDGSISVNYLTSSLEFRTGSPSEVMKQVEAFAVGVNSSASPIDEPSINENIPSSWSVVKDMNCQKAIYHYLRWHSTVLMTNDFEFSGTDQNIQYFDADRENIYSAVQTLMDGTLSGNLVASREGKLWAEVSAAATDNASTAFPLNMPLDNYDWMGTVRIREEQTKRISFLEMGGIYFPGPGFDSTPLLSSAPSSTPSYRGGVEKLAGAALSSQAQLNTLVGNVFAWKNAKYPSVKLDLSGNYRNLDIAPIERIRMNLSSEDNVRGISWSNKDFVLRSMDFRYDPEKEKLLSSIDLHEITQGMDGVTISIPPVPPTTGPTGGFNIPQIQVPSIPSYPISIQIGGGNLPALIMPTGGWQVGASQAITAYPGSFGGVQNIPCSGSDDVRVGAVVFISTAGTYTFSLVMTRRGGASANTLFVENSVEEYTLDSAILWESHGNSDYFDDYVAAIGSDMHIVDTRTLTVSAGSMVALGAARDGSIDTNSDLFGIVGWYIE